jgi:endonuclease G
MIMRTLILIFLICLVNIGLGQDTVRLKHTNFTTVFDKSKKYPVLVEWWTTKAMVSCATPLKRKDNFKADPKLPVETDIAKDYVNSGMDRGHMMPAADNLCQTQQVQDECFYFSNMAAQYHRLNAGDWKSLETFVRNEAQKKDSIRVWTGNIGEIKKIGRVSVPKQCWKVIYIKNEKKFRGFLFENDLSTPNGFEDNEVPVEKIEKLTGFKFR